MCFEGACLAGAASCPNQFCNEGSDVCQETAPVKVLDTGDPNERVCNPKSYNDLGNGIVRDNVTGLEWVQDGNLMATRNPEFDSDGSCW